MYILSLYFSLSLSLSPAMDSHHLFKCRGTFVGHAVCFPDSNNQHYTSQTMISPSLSHLPSFLPSSLPSFPLGSSLGSVCIRRHAFQCIFRQYNQGTCSLFNYPPYISTLILYITSLYALLNYTQCYTRLWARLRHYSRLVYCA